MKSLTNLIANPVIVFREEFDDWALLFDPDTGRAYGINPIAAFIWKRLDGTQSLPDIIRELSENCEGVPDNAEEDVKAFLQGLMGAGFAGHEVAD